MSKNIFLIFVFIIFTVNLNATQQKTEKTSTSETLYNLYKSFNGKYNIIIAPLVITDQRHRKSKISIKRGFKDQINKLNRIITSKDLHANLVVPKRFARKNKHERLVTQNLLKLNNDLLYVFNETVKNETDSESTKSDDGMDDFSESDFENVNTQSEEKNEIENIAENSLFNVANIYLGKNVSRIEHIKVPLRKSNGQIIKMLNPNSVFLEVFTPFIENKDYYFNLRVFVVILNTTTNTVTVMTKEMKNAHFNNNSALISGKTGHILKEIIGNAINKQL